MHFTYLSVAFLLSEILALAEILVAAKLYKKHRIALLSSFFYYILLMNIFSFYGYFQPCFTQLFFGDHGLSSHHQALIQVITTYLAIPFLIIGDYMIIKFFHLLVGGTVSKAFTWIFFSIQILIFVSTGLILTAYADMEAVSFLSLKGVFEIVYLIIDGVCVMIALSQYFFCKKENVHPDKIRVSKIMTILYLCLILPSYSFYFIGDRVPLLYALGIVFIHTVDLPPLLFLYAFMKKHNALYDTEYRSLEDLVKHYGLTRREREIFELIREGKTNGQIAQHLFISLQTVKDHVYHLFQKTGVSNRVQLISLEGDSRTRINP